MACPPVVFGPREILLARAVATDARWRGVNRGGTAVTLAATGVPKGLTFDPATGALTGTVASDAPLGPGTMVIAATDSEGTYRRAIRFIVRATFFDGVNLGQLRSPGRTLNWRLRSFDRPAAYPMGLLRSPATGPAFALRAG